MLVRKCNGIGKRFRPIRARRFLFCVDNAFCHILLFRGGRVDTCSEAKDNSENFRGMETKAAEKRRDRAFSGAQLTDE